MKNIVATAGIVTMAVSSYATSMAPTVAKVPKPVVTVASYNICKQACGAGRFSWDNRRPAVVRSIVASHADVVLVQEAANSVVEIAEDLSAYGYRLANSETGKCPGNCTLDSFVFYRESTIAPAPLRTANPPIPEACQTYLGVDQPPFQAPAYPEYPTIDPNDPGYQAALDEYYRQLDAYDAAYRQYTKDVRRWWTEWQSCQIYANWQPFTENFEGTNTLAQVANTQWPAAIMDRGWSYAYLRDKRSGAGFLAVSVHLPNEKTDPGERVRLAAARGLLAAIEKDKSQRGLMKVPTILGGDLNSYQRRQPRGAQFLFKKGGFTDAYTAPARTNGDAATVNVTPAFPNPFPPRPFRSADPARIDYVLFNRGKAVHYEVLLKLKGGQFNNKYRGSDHNLVLGSIRIPVVTFD